MNPLQELSEHGQSPWLDYIRRHMILSGDLQRRIDEDGLRGITSNPSIFEKALSGSTDYDGILKSVENQQDQDAMALYESFAIRDIQDAADVLFPVYQRTDKLDGYISLEVSPYLATLNAAQTISEAKRLWGRVGRPNLLVKIPGTPDGAAAIQEVISEGISVNVTLLFAQTAYEAVAEAYIAGLEARVASGGSVDGIASVASFFISRIDAAIDGLINAKLKTTTDSAERAKLQGLLGKIAIANAKLTYKKYQEIYSSPRWKALADKGAKPQRLLWASTSTKNPAYRDVLYVEELIGPETVNTMPPATMDAFKDHGIIRQSITENVDQAAQTMQDLESVGISMKEVTEKLLTDAVKLFSDSFDQLLSAVEKKREMTLSDAQTKISYKLPEDLDAKVKASLEEWRVGGKIRRLWARDAGLWTGDDESKWLDWLTIVDQQIDHKDRFASLADEAAKSGLTHAVLLGMGGSSLCVEVLALTLGDQPGFPQILVLDSTDPAQIRTLESKIDIAKTLFIVSSKSGSTLEPNIYKDYFYGRVKDAIGEADAGSRFIAITDPGSKLEAVAQADKFRHIYSGIPGIGGRYSALSNFGMVPAAIQGIDVSKFLNSAEIMVHACDASVPPPDNPGVILGTILGVLANEGRDKVTIIASPGIYDLGAWLEQLLAESTGKIGKGLIPVDQEPLGVPDVYGQDRVFTYVRQASAPDASQDAAVDALEAAGQPVVRISIADVYEIGQEFFRWEIATAVAGSIIGINAFNQPDVEASKIETRKLTDQYEHSGSLPDEKPFFEADGIKLFADENNASALTQAVGDHKTLDAVLKAHLNRVGTGDYVALLAYIERNGPHHDVLQSMRTAIRDDKKVATCLGFGPRFLHSTGQAYKGGPNTGVVIQITSDDAKDLTIPGHTYTFGVVKAAQARGDFEVLNERGRRALRVHLGPDVASGLETLKQAITRVLG